MRLVAQCGLRDYLIRHLCAKFEANGGARILLWSNISKTSDKAHVARSTTQRRDRALEKLGILVVVHEANTRINGDHFRRPRTQRLDLDRLQRMPRSKESSPTRCRTEQRGQMPLPAAISSLIKPQSQLPQDDQRNLSKREYPEFIRQMALGMRGEPRRTEAQAFIETCAAWHLDPELTRRSFKFWGKMIQGP